MAGDVLSLSELARRLSGAPSDALVLGMGSGMAQIFIPRLFREFERVLPGVRLELVTAPTRTIFNDLHEERIDAGIAIESDPERVPAGLIFDRLTEAEMALIVGPNHRLARSRRPVDLGRLVAEPIIMSELTVGYGQVVLGLFADLGARPNILAVADNIETMKTIVAAGKGVAVVPRASAELEARLGALKIVPMVPRPSVSLSLFRRRPPMSRRKEAYLAALREALRD